MLFLSIDLQGKAGCEASKLGMESLMPFVGMLIVVMAQVCGIILNKKAMSKGLSEFILALYSNAISTLILMPCAFLIHRSEIPPLNLSVLSSFFLLGLIGGSGTLMGNAGLQYSSATLNTAMLNLVPAFTFILALAFRMEKLNWRSSSSRAKSVGTAVSIAGAFVVTFYKGSRVIKPYNLFGLTNRFLFSTQSLWILGGFLLAAESFSISLWLVLQASILKKYPAPLISIAIYCLFVTVEITLISLIVVKDQSSWRLQPDIELVAVLYTGIGNAFLFVVITWCLQRKGPVYVSTFKPLAVVVIDILDVTFLGEALYLGSLVGGVVIITGFYAVMWGKAKEDESAKSVGEEGSRLDSSPLLPNRQ